MHERVLSHPLLCVHPACCCSAWPDNGQLIADEDVTKSKHMRMAHCLFKDILALTCKCVPANANEYFMQLFLQRGGKYTR